MSKKNTPQLLTKEQIQSISGGISASDVFGSVHGVLEFTHHFMGFREFVNYFADLYYNGNKNVEEDDYFTRFFIGGPKSGE